MSSKANSKSDLDKIVGTNSTTSTTSYNKDQRYTCPVCLNAKLGMVYGVCQHRVCEECLYGDAKSNDASKYEKTASNLRKIKVCPICKTDKAFPKYRPCIPDDNVMMYKDAGIIKCDFKGCTFTDFGHSMDDHKAECKFKPKVKVAKKTVFAEKKSATKTTVIDSAGKTTTSNSVQMSKVKSKSKTTTSVSAVRPSRTNTFERDSGASRTTKRGRAVASGSFGNDASSEPPRTRRRADQDS